MNVKRTILFIAACMAALILSAPASAHQVVEKYPKHWTWKQEKAKHYPNGSGRPIWMDPIFYAVAACEQPYGKGSEWDASSPGYVTGFGFARSTWLAYRKNGYPYDATQASTWQMYQVALAVHRDYGFSGWGCYTGGGYKYHL